MAQPIDISSGPIQAAAARLDHLIDTWAETEPGSQLTELVRVRGLLGVGPIVEAAHDDDLLSAAAARVDVATELLQVAGGSSEQIVVMRDLSRTFRAWLDGAWVHTPRNVGLRQNAIALAGALVTGKALPSNPGM